MIGLIYQTVAWKTPPFDRSQPAASTRGSSHSQNQCVRTIYQRLERGELREWFGNSYAAFRTVTRGKVAAVTPSGAPQYGQPFHLRSRLGIMVLGFAQAAIFQPILEQPFCLRLRQGRPINLHHPPSLTFFFGVPRPSVVAPGSRAGLQLIENSLDGLSRNA